MSLFALHLSTKLDGSSEPDNEGTDDDIEEEAPL
jgi:hypothetical protein